VVAKVEIEKLEKGKDDFENNKDSIGPRLHQLLYELIGHFLN
jgi:hypothetical protein